MSGRFVGGRRGQRWVGIPRVPEALQGKREDKPILAEHQLFYLPLNCHVMAHEVVPGAESRRL